MRARQLVMSGDHPTFIYMSIGTCTEATQGSIFWLSLTQQHKAGRGGLKGDESRWRNVRPHRHLLHAPCSPLPAFS